MTNVTRVPLYQLDTGDDYVATDRELGHSVATPTWEIQLRWCLGSLWAEQYQPDMQAVYRYYNATTGGQRLGLESSGVNWPGYVRGVRLGWAFPADARSSATDLVTITPYVDSHTPDFSYVYWNGVEVYPGHPPPETQAPRQAVQGDAFRIHAPRVIRVSYNPHTYEMTITPDIAEITRGTGAPIVWLRGNGIDQQGSRVAGQQWGFAYLSFAWHDTQPTRGNTVIQTANFATRHMTPDQIVVVDNFETGAAVMDFDYRLSILDHNSNGIVTRDPKVRNGTGVGSGGTPGGG